MRALRRLGAGAVTTALAGTALAGTASAASTTGTSHEPGTCASGAVPVEVVGSPGVKAQAAEGLYLWHGKTGYALRVTHPGKQKVTFTGTITVSNTISDVRKFRLEKADTLKVGPHRHTLTFRFTNYGYLDGVSFAAGCSKKVTVKVSIDGKAATTNQVFLGKVMAHPTSVPFIVERTKTVAPVTG
jgi:hypothetical protein